MIVVYCFALLSEKSRINEWLTIGPQSSNENKDTFFRSNGNFYTSRVTATAIRFFPEDAGRLIQKQNTIQKSINTAVKSYSPVGLSSIDEERLMKFLEKASETYLSQKNR